MNLPSFTATKLDQIITGILVMSDRPSQRKVLTRAITEAYLLGEKEERERVLNILDLLDVWTNEWTPRTAQEAREEIEAAIRKEIDGTV